VPEHSAPVTSSRDRLAAIVLDESSIARGNANVDHEREVAIYDLIDSCSFKLAGHDSGPYRLAISLSEDRLQFKVSDDAEAPLATHNFPVSSLRRILKDYFIVLDSYYQAVRNAQPSKIEAIDVGRRGLHDEGAQILIDRLAGKIDIDFDTARRLFTLIAALHWKG
jgi:uncharacterized protein (UPF0262 family)